jgi:hypothetical protein
MAQAISGPGCSVTVTVTSPVAMDLQVDLVTEAVLADLGLELDVAADLLITHLVDDALQPARRHANDLV